MALPQREKVAKQVLAIRASADFASMQRIHGSQQLLSDRVKCRNGAVVREEPRAMSEGMCVLDRWRTNGRSPNMCHHGCRVDTGSGFAEVLAMPTCPRLLFNGRQAPRMVGYAPSVTMHKPVTITPALNHQGVLGFDEATLHPRRLISPQSIQSAH
jgi:hypothetical protein